MLFLNCQKNTTKQKEEEPEKMEPESVEPEKVETENGENGVNGGEAEEKRDEVKVVEDGGVIDDEKVQDGGTIDSDDEKKVTEGTFGFNFLDKLWRFFYIFRKIFSFFFAKFSNFFSIKIRVEKAKPAEPAKKKEFEPYVSETDMVQVTNVTCKATEEQMSVLFSFVGPIVKIEIFPKSDEEMVKNKVGILFIFFRNSFVGVFGHL